VAESGAAGGGAEAIIPLHANASRETVGTLAVQQFAGECFQLCVATSLCCRRSC
jgi:hypothetical protein